MAAIIPVQVPPVPPGLLLRLVDSLQKRFFPEEMDSTTARGVALAYPSPVIRLDEVTAKQIAQRS